MQSSILGFDADGVLLDSQDLACRTSEQIVALFGTRPRIASRRDQIMAFGRDAQRGLVGEEASVLREMHRLLMRHRAEDVGLFEEVLALIPGLSRPPVLISAGYSTGVQRALGSHVQHFAAILGREAGPKEALMKAWASGGLAWYVTDTVSDIDRCRSYRINVIAVTWGYDSKEALSAAEPEILVSNPAELARVLGDLRFFDSSTNRRVMMTNNNDLIPITAMELALKAAGHRFPRLTQLGGTPNGSSNTVNDRLHLRLDAPEVTHPAFFLLDVTMTENQKIHLIEANGSNAALSSSAPGWDADRERADHMAFSFRIKPKPSGPVVAILSHPENLVHVPEFYRRAETFGQRLSEHGQIKLRASEEKLGGEDVTVVCGGISKIAPLIEVRNRVMFYRNHPVVFAANPNLLPELVRLGKIGREGSGYSVDDACFHEGHCTPIVHDKALQQGLAEGTEITPLMYREVKNREGWLEALGWFRDRQIASVAKMNGGSGGAGIDIIAPDMTKGACVATLDNILDSSRRKYGESADATVFPVRIFEFAQARSYVMDGKPHLWDLRLQCLVSPGRVDIRPCVVRLCPEPFDGSFSWNSCVSNLTGRDPCSAMRFMRTPNDVMDESELRRVMRGCGEWCRAASRWAKERFERKP